MLLCERVDEVVVDRATKRLRILTHPIRIEILDLLFKSKGMSISEIYTAVNLKQPDASQHLTILKEFGYVKKEIRNTKRLFILNEMELNKVMNLVDEVVKEFDED
jgi:DNA-binding transcriptional ArsR family regulator